MSFETITKSAVRLQRDKKPGTYSFLDGYVTCRDLKLSVKKHPDRTMNSNSALTMLPITDSALFRSLIDIEHGLFRIQNSKRFKIEYR